MEGTCFYTMIVSAFIALIFGKLVRIFMFVSSKNCFSKFQNIWKLNLLKNIFGF
jgi:ABC-type methionine transport system permease subunit